MVVFGVGEVGFEEVFCWPRAPPELDKSGVAVGKCNTDVVMFVAFDKEDFEFVEVVEPAVDDKFFVAKLLERKKKNILELFMSLKSIPKAKDSHFPEMYYKE